MKLASLMAGAAAQALVAAPAMAGTSTKTLSAASRRTPRRLHVGQRHDRCVHRLRQNQWPWRSRQRHLGLHRDRQLGQRQRHGVEPTTTTFTLKGAVSTDYAYYTGNASTTIDFGTIGIYASDDTGPANAFDMTAPANVTIDTNLAGCNTSNTVTVSDDIRGLVMNKPATPTCTRPTCLTRSPAPTASRRLHGRRDQRQLHRPGRQRQLHQRQPWRLEVGHGPGREHPRSVQVAARQAPMKASCPSISSLP